MTKTIRRKTDTIAGGIGILNEPAHHMPWLQSRFDPERWNVPMTDILLGRDECAGTHLDPCGDRH